MAKIKKSGIFRNPEFEFPSKPPAGLTAVCPNCFAHIETEEEEKAEVAKRKDLKAGLYVMGWKIPCPECSRKVFFFCEKSTRKAVAYIMKMTNGIK